MPTRDDALWDLYAGAVIECRVDGRLLVLRGPDAASLPAAAPIFVLTAHNPAGEPRDAARNDADEAMLERELTAEGSTFWRAVGRARDASWSEPGVAVADMDRSQACAYGSRYGQLAVYELTDDEVRVVRCDDAEAVRIATRTQ